MITMGFDGCGREVPLDFRRRLKEFNRSQNDRWPIRLIWNALGHIVQHPGWATPYGELVYRPMIAKPRWEVWVRWDELSHPKTTGKRKSDVRLIDGELCVKVSPYTDGGEYAEPFNENFFRVARIQDVMRTVQLKYSGAYAHMHSTHGSETEIWDAEKRETYERLYNPIRGGYDYHNRYDSPIIGAHRGKYGKADWRWRQR